jgi:long-chain acyl-CoA synthetase
LLVHTALLASDALRLGPDDRVLATLPLAHSYGLRITLLAPLLAGAEIVLARRFDAARTLHAMSAFGVTFAPVVPTMLAAWCDVPRARDEDLTALRFVLSAGAPLPDALALRAEARLGCTVRQGYGMTEATFSAVDAPPGPRVLGSVGRVVLGVELRVVDADGHALPSGKMGELIVRGHHTMLGYDDDAETEAVRLPGGFLRSGDLGRIDADGRVWVLDRAKDLILRGGANVAPSTVERALASAPGVREVAVFGVPHDYYGEEVVAAVRLDDGATPDADALTAHAATRLAHHEVPRAFVFIDAIPASATGKVDRRGLRDAVARGALTLVRSAPRRPAQSE